MSPTSIPDLLTRPLRAGGSYDLVLFDRLSEEEQVLLAEVREDPQAYGILRPHDDTGLTVKVVDRDTALLYLTLTTPGALPRFAWSGGPDAARRRVAALVLDRVLELEVDGRFVAGAGALGALGAGCVPTERTRLAALSHAALQYGEALALDDPEALAGRLYAYGRQPTSPAWARRIDRAETVLAYLGAAPGSELRRRLDAAWQQAADPEAGGWLAWSRGGARRARVGKATFKLYVSPSIAAAPRAFAAVVDTLANLTDIRFKVGGDAVGLLRPDKLVVYCADQEALLGAADALMPALADVPAHGVPFTAAVTDDGLLSWGMDPPPSTRIVSWQGYESWRLWLVRRLAAALIAARHAEATALAPWQVALERLRLDGVDVDHWVPSDSVWHKA